MDWTVIIAAAIAGIFAFLGSWTANRKDKAVSAYRLNVLEQTVAKQSEKIDKIWEKVNR